RYHRQFCFHPLLAHHSRYLQFLACYATPAIRHCHKAPVLQVMLFSVLLFPTTKTFGLTRVDTLIQIADHAPTASPNDIQGRANA
ncbi:hypothetical protein SB763_32845, partial [Burkholderia sp. SIMBA_042]|uniref:hypothetical protein n=1 Tax=Burkholderia sp. SIMBA_042 TaxID=3085783 RepID=UPI00397B5573